MPEQLPEMIEKIRADDHDLRFFAFHLAFEDMGIYPQAVVEGGVTRNRTEWQEGWNAYGTKLIEKTGEISRFLKTLPADALMLLETDKLGLMLRDKPQLYVNCNDLFYWACADLEYFELSELPALQLALGESSDHGELLWVCRKRGMRPQKPYYKYFNKAETELFNACGPERTD